MSAGIKRGVAAGVLGTVAIWPLLHFGLVRTLEINPWKLGGFAMYSEPVPPVLVVLLVPGDRGLTPLDEQTLPPPVQRKLVRFRLRRHALGQLVTPDGLGRSVLRHRPDLPAVVIAVQRLRLGGDARMVSTREQFVYDRGALD